MMQGLLNTMRAQAQRATQHRTTVQLGIVTNYNPHSYQAKVRLQPEDVPTGWLPIVSPWVGNGWGLFAPPSIGDLVEVQFQEGQLEAGFICQRFYNEFDRPLAVPEKEWWLVHQSASSLKFLNDGSVELHTTQQLRATVGGDAQLTVAGNLSTQATHWQHEGPVTINGNLTIQGQALVSEAITGEGGLSVSGGEGATVTGHLTVKAGDVIAEGVSLTHHTHGGVEPGGGQTAPPK